MRILVVSRFFWPAHGGHATVVRDLTRAWSAAGHGVQVLTTQHTKDLPPAEIADGVRVNRLPVTQVDYIGILRLVGQVTRYVKRHSAAFDAICVSMLKHCAFATLRGTNSGLPVVLRTEGGGKTGDVTWQTRAVLGGLIRRRCQRADAVVALTPEIHQELRAAGYEDGRIHRIPNGVAIPAIPWSAEETRKHRARLNLPDEPTFCFTGRLRNEKGIRELIDALSQLRASGQSCQLLLVGDGRDREELEKRAASAGVRDRVRLVGQVPDVEPFLRASDLFVLPSYQEGMSRSLLEAMAIGIPTVASDIEANRALAADHLVGFCPARDVDALAEALRRRLRETEQSAEMGAHSRQHVRARYGITAVAQSYVDLFAELARRRSRDTLSGSSMEDG